MSFLICTVEAGDTLAFPDVCKTPTPAGELPIPYSNIALLANSLSASTKVFACGAQILTKVTKIQKSTGDEPGTGGGVVSSGFDKKVVFTAGSNKVFVQGKSVIRQYDPLTGNDNNANGNVVNPSQFKVSAG
jgi:hypothetical protein